jgi:Zn-dependent protease
MSTEEMLAIAPMWYVAFLLSLTCHEAAHALVADWGGDSTAAAGGQVTLNPLPHIQREPFGTIFAPIISLVLAHWMIGWASAPYDPYWQQRYPRRAAWMALAGPAANFILAVVAAIAIRIGIATGYLFPPSGISFTRLVDGTPDEISAAIATFLSILFAQNLLLMSFNLLPVPPLDGHVAVGLFLSERATRKFIDFVRQPGWGLIGLIIAWNLFGQIFQPIFIAGVRLLYIGYGA